jgi:glycosyltransferase involved in cell wall biosynthesis
LKILQVSTYDFQGGAAIASYRLHRGLRHAGEDCRMLVQHKSSADDRVIQLSPRNQGEEDIQAFFLRTVIQGQYIDSNRTPISNTMFTLPYPGYDIAALPPVREANIINLQWVSGFQSPITLQRLFSLGKPVVWTLHDQWAFTGGCHYAAGCLKYQEDCAACPQLAEDPFNLPSAVLQDKKVLFGPAPLAVVTPSRWLARCVRESSLFRKTRVEVIPNSLDTEIFRPQSKKEAKEDLGLAPETVTLLFGATDCAELRKGFQKLLAAVGQCLADSGFRTLVEGGRVKILCFGDPGPNQIPSGLPVIPLGFLDSVDRIRTAYSAAEAFILPSMEDNLPNTILEALSCGTPVVAFSAGGIPDVVKDGENGRLAPVGDSGELAQAILFLLSHPQESDTMGRNGRKLMLKEYSLPVQARRYRNLYEELCRTHEASPPLPLAGAAMDPPQEIDAITSEGFQMDPATGLGPHVEAIFDPTLFWALKQYAPSLHRRWRNSETDRAARLDQIVELTRMLKDAEADRAKLYKQVVDLDRQVAELNAHWTVEVRRRVSRLLGRRRLPPLAVNNPRSSGKK